MTQKKHTRQNHAGFWIGLALISAQVSWVPTANSAAATEQPAWFKTAMAKEKKRLRRGSKFVLDGDVLTGKIPGKIISRPEKSEGSWYFSSNIGTDSPLECAYYEEPLNIAQATSEVADNIVAAMVNAHGPMKSKALMAASVGHNEGRPVLALEWALHSRQREQRSGWAGKSTQHHNRRYGVVVLAQRVGLSGDV